MKQVKITNRFDVDPEHRILLALAYHQTVFVGNSGIDRTLFDDLAYMAGNTVISRFAVGVSP